MCAPDACAFCFDMFWLLIFFARCEFPFRSVPPWICLLPLLHLTSSSVFLACSACCLSLLSLGTISQCELFSEMRCAPWFLCFVLFVELWHGSCFLNPSPVVWLYSFWFPQFLLGYAVFGLVKFWALPTLLSPSCPSVFLVRCCLGVGYIGVGMLGCLAIASWW